jgi:DNA-binding HxlR family transcriptional regulator
MITPEQPSQTTNEKHDCHAAMSETMSRTLQLIGDTWTLMIVYNLMSGTRRFGELLDALGNVSPKTLSQRLKMLEAVKFVERKAYAEIPPRVEYQLTEKGYALIDIVKAMQEFGERYLANTEPPEAPCH